MTLRMHTGLLLLVFMAAACPRGWTPCKQGLVVLSIHTCSASQTHTCEYSGYMGCAWKPSCLSKTLQVHSQPLSHN